MKLPAFTITLTLSGERLTPEALAGLNGQTVQIRTPHGALHEGRVVAVGQLNVDSSGSRVEVTIEPVDRTRETS